MRNRTEISLKRLILSLVCLLFIASPIFAIKNVGDYTLDDVDNRLCTELITYMKNNDLIEDYTYYGFYKTSSGLWQLNLSDSLCKNDLQLFFSEDWILICRYSDKDYSSVSEDKILDAINNFKNQYACWQTFYLTKGEICAHRMITTKGLTVKTLADEIYWFNIVSILGFNTILSEVNGL